jgi:Domain of unknown function (DUF4334)
LEALTTQAVSLRRRIQVIKSPAERSPRSLSHNIFRRNASVSLPHSVKGPLTFEVFRSGVTATMVMTASPSHDHFKKIDDNAVPDVMNGNLAIPRFTRQNARGARCGVRSRIVPST